MMMGGRAAGGIEFTGALSCFLRGSGSGGRIATFDVGFRLFKAGTDMLRDCAAPKFDGDAWGRAFHEGDDDDAKHVIVGMFLVRRFGHVSSDRTDEAVAEQNAQERADE